MAYAVGLTGYSVVKIASPTFYALGESRTPVMVSVLSVLTNAALNILFVREFGYRGLALGTSLTALLNAGLLMLLLRRRLDGLHARAPGQRRWSASPSPASSMGVAAWGLDRELQVWMPGTACRFRSCGSALAIGGALLVLALALKLLRVTRVHRRRRGDSRAVQADGGTRLNAAPHRTRHEEPRTARGTRHEARARTPSVHFFYKPRLDRSDIPQ